MTDAELEELAAVGAAVIALSQRPAKPDPDPLTLSATKAAERLGVSRDFLRQHVIPEIRVIRRGARVLVPLSELERWIERSAAKTIE